MIVIIVIVLMKILTIINYAPYECFATCSLPRGERAQGDVQPSPSSQQPWGKWSEKFDLDFNQQII